VCSLKSKFRNFIHSWESLIRGLPGVNKHFITLGKAFSTMRTRVGSDSSMNELVPLQKVAVLKSFVAKRALVRSISGMGHPQMHFYFTSTFKGCTTKLTNIWPFTCVNTTMLLHIAFMGKRFVTNITQKRFLSWMYAKVCIKTGPLGKP